MRRDRAYRCVGAFLGAGLVFATTAYGDVPRLVSYQGRLAGGGAGPVDLVVRFYDSEAGPNVLFTETHLGVLLQDGVFSILLGSQSGAGVTDAALNASQVWLGLSVNGGAEFSPRTRIGMVPFAAKSRSSEQLVRPGTMSPAVTVAGSGRVYMENRGLLVFDDAGHGINLTSDTVEFNEGTSEDPVYDYSSSTDTHRFWTNGTRRVVIDASGNVGVGELTPSAKLHLGGNPGVDGLMFPDGTLQTTAAGGGDSWALTGNAGTTPGVNFLGTTDDQPLELVVDGTQALRIEPSASTPNLVGGYKGNSVTAGVVAATIGGGGSFGETNRVTDEAGVIGGGRGNQAGDDIGTTVDARYATVAGGHSNTASGLRSTIGGGENNTASGINSAVGGGANNTASNGNSAIGGGANNDASGSASAIAGGLGNTASGDRSAVGGGEDNLANGYLATVPGGTLNEASGSYSFAAGQRAQANHAGSFVWSDSTTADPDFFSSTSSDQFLIRASGGVGINTNAPGAALHIGGIAGTDGLMFPDGTVQTTAAVGGGGSLWFESGSDIYYDTGNVGVGSTNAAYPLDVRSSESTTTLYAENTAATGNAIAATAGTGNGATAVRAETSSTNGYAVHATNNATSSNAYAVYAKSMSPTGIAFRGHTSGVNGYGLYLTGGRHYIGGNVGIGTSSPQAKLHVAGTPGVDGIKFPDGSVQTTAATGGTGDSLWSESGANIYYNAGRVGIGTANPSSKLHLAGADANLHMIESGGSPFLAVGDTSTIVGWLQWNSPDNQLDIYTYGHNYPIAIGSTDVGGIFVDTTTNDCNVGIGTTNPLQSLHILGDAGLYRGIYNTIDLQPAENGTEGALVQLSQDTGTPTIVFDADYKTDMGTDLGGKVDLNLYNGTTGLTLRASSSGGGLVQINDNGGSSRASLGAFSSTGGYLTLNDAGNQTGIRIYADSAYGSHVGGTISLRDNNDDKLGLFANFEGSGFSRVVSDVIQINGGADLSEQFDVAPNGVALEPGMVVAIDPDRPGKLTVAGSPYDRKVAGIISGAGGVKPGMLMGQQGSIADGKHAVALTGRVWTLCDASAGAIRPGDLLTSSATDGHAMKVVDYAKAQGAIIGKAMTSLEEGAGLVLVLVSLQ